jgi:twitching motility protein PilT
MVCTPAIQHLIRDHKTHSIFSAIQTGHQLGMIAMDDSLVERTRSGKISREEALRLAQNPLEVEEKLNRPVGAAVGHRPMAAATHR